ncbi:DNA-binding domain-containing protein [Piscinibacter sp. HJYY11]|uniref:HvfC/BufC N-terminal domain-containing protein n=1 Tax=Piscinibacter sp. HJYY11 TaxID=2801333 RepID=UPI00191D52CF|nr:DNA-binding domain-containing protein [Piscinibacter sp. HJYY11]MBL0730481.1 putative DNA-binding domain-containing protein [Piscinibacter sp. HJYY11]
MSTEVKRQQALMAAILQREEGTALAPWLAARPAGVARGLQAYQANAGASAERSLAAAFPTVQALVGDDSFAALSRAFWHAEPPVRGDLAQFGAGLPSFIAASEQLADVPYLADVARLDWLLAEAERAQDAEVEPASLQLLSELDPAQLRLQLMPGVALLNSAHPVVSVWQAHRSADVGAQLRAALEAAPAEHALVWRDGWRACAEALDAAAARWMKSLLAGESLAMALIHAGEGFAFEPWLVQALQRQWLWRAVACDR